MLQLTGGIVNSMLKIFLLLLAFSGVFGTATVRADGDGERAALARLIHELDALNAIINEAQSQAGSTGRIRFQYGWLKQDLARVTLGIRDHLDAPRAVPREFPPLKGDYRR